jgi:penicillin-binding protein 1B
LRYLLVAAGLAFVALSFIVGYSFVRLSRQVDARLQGGIERALPRIFARPLELRRGQALSPREVDSWLDDLGYRERPALDAAGQFTAAPLRVTVRPRAGSCQGQEVALTFSDPTGGDPAKKAGPLAQRLTAIEVAGRGAVDDISLDAPMLSALVTGDREKRRRVPLAAIPPHVRQAVLAIEDRRF